MFFYLPLVITSLHFSAATELDSKQPLMVLSRAGTLQLRYKGHTFNKHVTRGEKVYWRCSQYLVYRCKVRIQTMLDEFSISKNDHNHPVVVRPRAYGSLKLLKQRLGNIRS